MGQTFSPKSNAIAKLTLWALVVLIFGGVAFATAFVRSDYVTGKNDLLEQPVPFSHKHHVKGLGLDCRFCHTTVERGAFAGIPDTQTCMNCHSEIWKQSAALKPVRDSYEQGTPIAWLKIHRLPGYVYFDHSVHIHQGVGCVSCHGEVSEMPRIKQVRTFKMKDCVECHEHPEQFVRSTSEVFNEHYVHPTDLASENAVVKANHVHIQTISDCARCHR